MNKCESKKDNETEEVGYENGVERSEIRVLHSQYTLKLL